MVERLVHTLMDRLQTISDGERRVGDDFPGNLSRRRQQLFRRHHAIDQSPTQRFLGGERLPAQDHFECHPLADQARQALRASVAGNNAELDFRLAQTRCLAGDAERTGQRQLASPAQGKSVDGSDGRFAEMFDAVQDGLPPQRTFLGLLRGIGGQFADVGAGDKRLLPGSGEDHRPDAGILLQALETRTQLFDRPGIERVQHLGAIDGDRGDLLATIHQQVFVCHAHPALPAICR